MSTNRRDFLKKLGFAGAVGTVAALPAKSLASVVTDIPTEDDVKVVRKIRKTSFTEKQEAAIERQIRRCIRRDGGFRFGTSSVEQNHARELLRLLNRKKIIWDTTIKLEGKSFGDVNFYNSPDATEEERKRDVDV